MYAEHSREQCPRVVSEKDVTALARPPPPSRKVFPVTCGAVDGWADALSCSVPVSPVTGIMSAINYECGPRCFSRLRLCALVDSQASDPLSFMHPPLVVPDALRLSGLAALSGVPLQGSDPTLLSAAAASLPPQQQLQSWPAAAALSDAPSMPSSHGGGGNTAGRGSPDAAAHVPVSSARRPAKQPAAPEREAKRRRATQQQAVVVPSPDVPVSDLQPRHGSNADAAGAAGVSEAAGAGKVEPMEADNADAKLEVRTS